MIQTRKESLSRISEVISFPIDVFVCSASFEERCKSVADHMDPESIKKALVCYNEDQPHLVNRNKDYLLQRFYDKAIAVPLATNNPIQIADNLITHLVSLRSSIGSPIKFLFDITTFTHEALLILLKALSATILDSEDQVQLIYTPAKEYSTNESDRDKKWLSRGVGEIRSVLGYAGELIPTRKNHLVILVGFEVERALKLIESYEPSLISLGLGHERYSIEPHHHSVNKKKREEIARTIQGIYPDIHFFEFSLVDPVATRTQIKAQILGYSQYNVIIAPLNNKISTLGVALLAREMHSIQLCYATADIYNIEYYSTPGEDCYIVDSITI